MTDIPFPLSASRSTTRGEGSVLSRSLSGLGKITRLWGRSFSSMHSRIAEAQMMLYCDPYGLQDKKRTREERY